MSAMDRAVRAIDQGRVVLYPTDTLLGLGVRPDDPRALAELFRVKRRPGGVPVSLAFSSVEEVEAYADLSPMARRTLRELLPGPYTFLVRAARRPPRPLLPQLLGPGGRLGVRVPDHPVARELARRGGPLTSTSANRHGEPPLRTVTAARSALGDEVAVYLEAEPAPSGTPSQLVDLTGSRPRPVARKPR